MKVSRCGGNWELKKRLSAMKLHLILPSVHLITHSCTFEMTSFAMVMTAEQ